MIRAVRQSGEWCLVHRNSVVPFRFGHRLKAEINGYGFTVTLESADGISPLVIFVVSSSDLGICPPPHLMMDTIERYAEWRELCVHYNRIVELLESLSDDYDTAWTMFCILEEYDVRAVSDSEIHISPR